MYILLYICLEIGTWLGILSFNRAICSAHVCTLSAHSAHLYMSGKNFRLNLFVAPRQAQELVQFDLSMRCWEGEMDWLDQRSRPWRAHRNGVFSRCTLESRLRVARVWFHGNHDRSISGLFWDLQCSCQRMVPFLDRHLIFPVFNFLQVGILLLLLQQRLSIWTVCIQIPAPICPDDTLHEGDRSIQHHSHPASAVGSLGGNDARNAEMTCESSWATAMMVLLCNHPFSHVS